jgi:hypothetical protein
LRHEIPDGQCLLGGSVPLREITANFKKWSVLNGSKSRSCLTLSQASRRTAMNRKGIDFSLKQVESDFWKWQFQIGDTVTTGQTRSRLRGIAAHRAQKRIDLELRKPRDPMQ